jgi:hypothetical protein
VKYDTADTFRAALDQRIRNEATTTNLPVMRLRKRVAFERFLARLAVTEPGSWVLKGAFALELRLGVRTRATKDIDLARADDERTATARLIAAQAIDLHDHFSFDVARTAALDQAEAFRAVRYSVTAEVANVLTGRTGLCGLAAQTAGDGTSTVARVTTWIGCRLALPAPRRTLR